MSLIHSSRPLGRDIKLSLKNCFPKRTPLIPCWWNSRNALAMETIFAATKTALGLYEGLTLNYIGTLTKRVTSQSFAALILSAICPSKYLSLEQLCANIRRNTTKLLLQRQYPAHFMRLRKPLNKNHISVMLTSQVILGQMIFPKVGSLTIWQPK